MSTHWLPVVPPQFRTGRARPDGNGAGVASHRQVERVVDAFSMADVAEKRMGVRLAATQFRSKRHAHAALSKTDKHSMLRGKPMTER